MRSRKFPSFQEAKSYLEERGKLEYFGWEGQVEGYYVYNYTINGILYRLRIFKNGLVEIRE